MFASQTTNKQKKLFRIKVLHTDFLVNSDGMGHLGGEEGGEGWDGLPAVFLHI